MSDNPTPSAGTDQPTACPADAAGADASDGAALRLTDTRLRDLGRQLGTGTAGLVALRLGISATRVAQALLAARIVGHVLEHTGPVALSLIELAAVGVARLVLVAALGRRSAAAMAALRKTMRSRLYRKLSALGPAFLTDRRAGAVQTVLVGGVDRLADYFVEFVPLSIASTVTVLVVLAWIAGLDPLTATAMLGAAALVPIAPILTARAFGETGRRFAESLSSLAAQYLDAIQGLITLKAFNAAARHGEQLEADTEELASDATSLAGLVNLHVGFVSLGMAAGTVLGVALATLRVTHHAVAGSALLAIVFLAREAFHPLGDLHAAFPAAYDAVAAASGVIDVLDAPITVAPAARPPAMEVAALVPSVQFDRVTFGYRADHPPALDQVGFRVDAGETIALVGPSGAGKSTVVSLLLRFFDPSAGSISIGGHDIRSLDLATLRSLVSVSFQDSYLFHRSVADNLRLARPDATSTDLEQAARAAHAHDFVVELPDGYDTIIHERGVRLSGGQRQRLAIARALLANAPILVLDEPTSAVDARSEALITDAVAHLTRQRTTLIIAHRLSTIATAGRVIVLEDGRVVEDGSPHHLRATGGAFARLIEAQTRS